MALFRTVLNLPARVMCIPMTVATINVGTRGSSDVILHLRCSMKCRSNPLQEAAEVIGWSSLERSTVRHLIGGTTIGSSVTPAVKTARWTYAVSGEARVV